MFWTEKEEYTVELKEKYLTIMYVCMNEYECAVYEVVLQIPGIKSALLSMYIAGCKHICMYNMYMCVSYLFETEMLMRWRLRRREREQQDFYISFSEECREEGEQCWLDMRCRGGQKEEGQLQRSNMRIR